MCSNSSCVARAPISYFGARTVVSAGSTRLGQRDVVEPDHRQLTRDVDTQRPSRPNHAGSEQIVEGNDRCEVAVVAEEIERCGASLFERVAAV